jgi:PhzF family phenazine biosynthesis protein
VSTRIVQVDAFTDRPFRGNPAAVCVLQAPPEPAWMQDVAREMNLSETAFLWPERGVWRLRWFTPTAEVDLCGHATLAAAHVLWGEAHAEGPAPLAFETRSGALSASRADGLIWLDFPSLPPEPAARDAALFAALGVGGAEYVGRSRHDTLVELGSEAAVRALDPDVRALLAIPTRGVIVTARAEAPEHHFVSRFFAPRVGVDEDPVTGSAHCVLAPYWAERLGRPDLVGYQASARGGTVRTVLRGDRVALGGAAVTVMRGELV